MKANQGIKIARVKGSTGGDLNSFGFKPALLRDMGDFPFAKRAYKGPYLGSYAVVNYRLTKKDDAQSQAEEVV